MQLDVVNKKSQEYLDQVCAVKRENELEISDLIQ